MNLRIDKYLADMGLGTRSEIKNAVRKKQICVNGAEVRTPDIKVDTEKDTVTFKGSKIEYCEYEYFILNKPAGVLSATRDGKQKTVLDLIKEGRRKDLFPVGRLDKDTEGLLIITNDGAMAHELLSPSKHVDKTYYVRTDGILTPEHTDMFKKGVVIDENFTAMPADLVIKAASYAGSEALVTIKEGKYHQIKRMMEAAGSRVVYLKRISMGGLNLPENLKTGEYRRMTEEEINILKGIK